MTFHIFQKIIHTHNPATMAIPKKNDRVIMVASIDMIGGSPLLMKRLFSSTVEGLRRRHLISNITQGEFPSPGSTFYIGFDPTASSLHIGNLLGLIVATHLRLDGYNPILLVGGGTARVGDPSFRESSKERLDNSIIAHNSEMIKKQLLRVMDNGFNYVQKSLNLPRRLVRILDNLEWQKDLRLLEFLDVIGRNVRLSSMIDRDSVQLRLKSEIGMSFTEFTYQILQAYDFYHLFKNDNCLIQIGGSDQWGNMISGVELIKRLDSDPKGATVMTFPLLTTSNGEKMGKSLGNAIWLDSNLTSIFDFYQYFLRLTDEDAIRLLPMLTFLSDTELEDIFERYRLKRENRLIQEILAKEVTSFVHCPKEANEAINASKLLFDEYEDAILRKLDRDLMAKTLRQSKRSLNLVNSDDHTLQNILLNLLPDRSKNYLKTLCQSGGIYLNGKRADNLNVKLNHDEQDPVFIRIGKHQHYLIDFK